MGLIGFVSSVQSQLARAVEMILVDGEFSGIPGNDRLNCAAQNRGRSDILGHLQTRSPAAATRAVWADCQRARRPTRASAHTKARGSIPHRMLRAPPAKSSKFRPQKLFTRRIADQ